MKTSEIISFMESWAKKEDALSWDNCGPQIYFQENVKKILISLDLYDEVIEKAKKENCNLIITHHPMFFSGVKSIAQGTYMGDNIIDLIDHRITVFSAHTNLDIAQGGVNDTLADYFQLKERKSLAREEDKDMGIVGTLPYPMELKDFVWKMKRELEIPFIHIYGRPTQKVSRIALLGGSGADFIKDALQHQVDVYITSDLKYHDGQYAYEQNLTLLDLGHFHSEKILLQKIKEKLEQQFPHQEILIHMDTKYEIEHL